MRRVVMALFLSSTFALPCSKPLPPHNSICRNTQKQKNIVITRCESSAESPKSSILSLQIGSPVILIEAPTTLKTAASVPCLRVNSGLVKPGDVGRVVSRKPKDVWAVRLSIGTYLIDGKHNTGVQVQERKSTATPNRQEHRPITHFRHHQNI